MPVLSCNVLLASDEFGSSLKRDGFRSSWLSSFSLTAILFLNIILLHVFLGPWEQEGRNLWWEAEEDIWWERSGWVSWDRWLDQPPLSLRMKWWSRSEFSVQAYRIRICGLFNGIKLSCALSDMLFWWRPWNNSLLSSGNLVFFQDITGCYKI